MKRATWFPAGDGLGVLELYDEGRATTAPFHVLIDADTDETLATWRSDDERPHFTDAT